MTQRRSTRRRQVACWEAAKRMRAEVRHREDTTRWVEGRRDWPDFFEAVDEIVGLLDEDDPPIPILDARQAPTRSTTHRVSRHGPWCGMSCVARYAVRMEIRTDRPLKRDELERLAGAGHEIQVAGEPRRRTVAVSLVMSGGDVVGALARSINVVLDEVAGEIRYAEVTEARPRPAGTSRPTRSPKRR